MDKNIDIKHINLKSELNNSYITNTDFAKQFKSKSCYMFAVFDLNDRYLGTLGVDYNHSIYKLNKTEISYIKQKSIIH